jgi:hypothetical protein
VQNNGVECLKMGEQMFVMKNEVVSWPSAVGDDLVQSGRRCFIISELSCEFPQIKRNLLYIIITDYAITNSEQDGFRKCLWVRTK